MIWICSSDFDDLLILPTLILSLIKVITILVSGQAWKRYKVAPLDFYTWDNDVYNGKTQDPQTPCHRKSSSGANILSPFTPQHQGYCQTNSSQAYLSPLWIFFHCQHSAALELWPRADDTKIWIEGQYSQFTPLI